MQMDIIPRLSTLFKWKPGLAVKDPEMVAAVRNIDLGAVNAAAATVEQKKAVVDAMIRAQGRMRNTQYHPSRMVRIPGNVYIPNNFL